MQSQQQFTHPDPTSGNNYSENCREILMQLDDLKEKFYSSKDNKKHLLFKKSQKNECAKSVSDQVNIENVMNMSFFCIKTRQEEQQSDFYLNYSLMKMYLNDDNYQSITDALIHKLTETIGTGGQRHPIRVHMNLNTFSVSAAERYKHVVQYFSQKCRDDEIVLTPYISNLIIYYTPSVMDNIISILTLFIEPDMLSKLILIPKEESESKLEELFNY